MRIETRYAEVVAPIESRTVTMTEKEFQILARLVRDGLALDQEKAGERDSGYITLMGLYQIGRNRSTTSVGIMRVAEQFIDSIDTAYTG